MQFCWMILVIKVSLFLIALIRHVMGVVMMIGVMVSGHKVLLFICMHTRMRRS